VGCLSVIALFVIVFVASQFNSSSTPGGSNSAPSTPAALPATEAVRPPTNVRKKDGTIDARENDLNILCEDWRFFRGRILKATAEGDERKATEARQSFQRTNQWLNAYRDDDVAKACGS
jgi:hypothetical protein